MAEQLDRKASMLGRILAQWQYTANEPQPAVVIAAQLKVIHRLSGELIAELAKSQPGTTVHVDPSLGRGVTELLSEYFDGPPDTIPREWT